MLDRLGQADRFAGGGAILAIVASLLPWYHFDDGSDRITENAFGSGFWGDMVFLCGAAMLFVLLVRHGVIALRADLGSRTIDIAIGGIAMLAVVLQLLIGVNGSGAFHHATIGIAVALAASAAMVAGAWLRGSPAGHPVAASRRR